MALSVQVPENKKETAPVAAETLQIVGVDDVTVTGREVVDTATGEYVGPAT